MAIDNPLLRALQGTAPRLGHLGDFEEEPAAKPSTLRKLVSVPLSGLSIAGNILDVPGSMVRDTLAGQNPLDQLLTPWSDANRTTGRDLLRNTGLAQQQDTIGNFWGGIGTEILLDPTTYLGPGGLVKGAAAGLASGTSKVGKAASAGKGLLNLGLPLISKGGKELFTGPRAVRAAESVGQAAERIGNTKPLLMARQFLDSSVMERSTPEIQRVGRDIFEEQTARRAQIRAMTTGVARTLEQQGRTTAEAGAELRKQIELPQLGTSPEAQQLAEATRASRMKSRSLGLPGSMLEDIVSDLANPGQSVALGHVRRQINPEILKGARGTRSPISARTAEDATRNALLRGSAEGTEGFNKLFEDPELRQLAEGWSKYLEGQQVAGVTGKALSKERKMAVEHLAEKIGQNPHGAKIIKEFQSRKGNKLLFKLADKTEKWIKIGDEIPADATPVMKNRHEGLARWMIKHQKIREHTLFPNHPVVEIEHQLISEMDRQVAAEKLFDYVASVARPMKFGDKGNVVSVAKLLKDLKFDKGSALDQIAGRMANADDLLELDPEDVASAVEGIGNLVIDKRIADDLAAPWPKYDAPGESHLLLDTLDSFQALFKAGVLNWPARFVRDVTSGTIRNFENGWLTPSAYLQGNHIAQGRLAKGLTDNPAVRKWLADRGLEATDENATEAMKQIFAAHKSSGHAYTEQVNPVGVDPQLESILARVPGRRDSGELGFLLDVLGTAFGRREGTSWKPWYVRGFGGLTKSKFAPVVAGEMIGNYTDLMVRLPPFIVLTGRGIDPNTAMRMIDQAQVDYSTRAFTPHERILKRIFPFYSFTKQQIPYLTKELLSNPGGRLANMIRTTNRARGSEADTPDYVSQTTSIPLGETADGSDRYITGLGLMHEDPLSFLGGGLRGAGLETLSRANPLIKGPLEWITGETFFQTGPEGGRALEDLDPTLGRILANVTGQEQAVKFPASDLVEAVLGNSPASKLLTTARQFTDKRKGIGAKATNLFTGVRVSDISPAAQDAKLRELVQQREKELGAKKFQKVYFPEDVLEEMSPRQRQAAQELIDLTEILEGRAKSRSKARKKGG